MYKAFKGTKWQCVTLLTAFAFPAFLFGVFFILNLFVWGEASTAAVPFGTMVAVMALWFGVSVPLTFFGAFLGFRRNAYEYPVRTADIPRQIPPQQWYMNKWLVTLIGGLLPFGAVFVELFFILTSIWLDQYYYVFGFLLVVVIVLLVTCAEITIVLCYFQLCAEDYRWWWQSFPYIWLIGVVRFCLLHLLFLHPVSNNKLDGNRAILRIYANDQHHLLFCDWNCWFLCHVLLQP